MNYLRPDIKRGNITPDEDDLVIRLHSLLGNRWSLIAGRLPGRTDNEIKNYWNTHLSKRLRNQGTDPKTHKKQSGPQSTNNKKRSKINNSTTTTTTSTNHTKSNNKRKKNITNADNKVEAVNKITTMVTRNNVDPKRQKVHLPKPIRVTRNYSFEGNNATTSGSSSQEKAGSSEGTSVNGDDQVDVSWLSFKDGEDADVGLLVNDHHDRDQEQHDYHDYHYVNGSSSNQHEYNFECESQNIVCAEGQVHNATLQKLYEEYQQLLRTEDQQQQQQQYHHHHHHHHEQVELDLFAESLLI